MALIAVLLLPREVARAERWDETCLKRLSDDDVTLELTHIERSFAEQRVGASLWWSGWTAFNVFNAVLAWWKLAGSEKRLAFDSWLVSGIGASLFVAQVSAVPLPGLYGYRRLARLPDALPAQRREKLRRAFKLLDRAAMVERANSNWVAHLSGFAYAAASSGYVWIRNPDAGRHKLALAVGLQFATSIAFAELTFWTVPRRARHDFQRLREEVCRDVIAPAEAARSRASRAPRPASVGLTAGPGQLGLTAHF